PAPQGQHVVFRSGGQSGSGGKTFEEALVIRDHGLGARLLQHDLADQNGVRIAGLSPRKIAMTACVPVDQEGSDLLGFFGSAQSITRNHSATTAKPSGSTSHASNSGFRGSRRICSWRHSSSPVSFLRLV